jgi:hypothetical protein
MSSKPPTFNVPPGAAAGVSIIDTTTVLSDVPLELMLAPPMPGFPTFVAPAYSFLVDGPTGRKVLFDLGVRKDYWNNSPAVVEATKGWGIEVEKAVHEILPARGLKPEDIEAIIWR